MRFSLMATVAAGLFLAAVAVAQEKDTSAKNALIGTWSVVSIDTPDGQRIPDEVIKDSHIEFTTDKMILKEGDKTRESAYRADATKSIKEIDLVPADGPHKGKTLLGIYVIEGDTLKIYLSEPGHERPQSFTTRAKTRTGLIVLKRIKQ